MRLKNGKLVKTSTITHGDQTQNRKAVVGGIAHLRKQQFQIRQLPSSPQ